MPLSKARDAARQRNARAVAKGVLPSPTQLLEVLSPNQRKERLASLILTPIPPDKVNAAHVISAIDIYNKMDKLYSEGASYQDNRVINIIVDSEETKRLTEGVAKRLLKEGEDAIKG